MWIYIIVFVIVIYYTGLYEKCPEPISSLFSSLDRVLPGEAMTDDIEGVYESENTTHNTTYFIIGKDGTNLIYLKSKSYLSDTDDPKKFCDKQVEELKKNVFTDPCKKEIHKVNDSLRVDDIEFKKDGCKLLLIKNDATTTYIKIRNML